MASTRSRELHWPGKWRSRPFDEAPFRGGFHVDGNAVWDLTESGTRFLSFSFPAIHRWERKTEKSCTRFSQIPNSVPVHMESAAKGSLVKWTGTPLTRPVQLSRAG